MEGFGQGLQAFLNMSVAGWRMSDIAQLLIAAFAASALFSHLVGGDN